MRARGDRLIISYFRFSGGIEGALMKLRFKKAGKKRHKSALVSVKQNLRSGNSGPGSQTAPALSEARKIPCPCNRRRSTKLGRTGEDAQPRGRLTPDLGTAVVRGSPKRTRRAEQPGERLQTRQGAGHSSAPTYNFWKLTDSMPPLIKSISQKTP